MSFLRRASLVLSVASLGCGGSITAGTSDGGTVADSSAPNDASPTPTPVCSRSQQLCSGVCVDTFDDPANCGACGHACTGACAMGACVTIGVPPNPGGPPGDATGSVVFAMNKLYVGDTDRNGVPSQLAWKAYGLNLDGKVTDKTSTDVCTLAAGAARSTQTDGNGGIDNSWGENFLLILLTTAGQDFGPKVNQAIASGAFTTMLKIDHLGTQPSYSPLAAALFGGGPMTMPPRFDGTDVWPVSSDTVNNGDVTMPKVVFPASYMNARVWVSGATSGRITLPLVFSGVTFAMPIDHGVITMTVDPMNQSAVSGTIAGVIPTEELIAAIKLVAGRISTSLCSGSAFDSIAQQIRQASDMIHDGTNIPGVPCDAISIGLGFEARRVQLGAVVTPVASPDPCH